MTWFIAAATRCGCRVDGLASLPEVRAVLESGDVRSLSLAQLARLMDLIHARSVADYFPFAFAEAFSFDGWPSVSAYVASASTIRSLNKIWLWAGSLFHPCMRFQGSDDGQSARLTVTIEDPAGQLQNFPLLVESLVAVVHRVCLRAMPEQRLVRAVYFAHAPVVMPERYARHFDCPVGFAASSSYLEFDSVLLDAGLRGALPFVNARAEEALLVEVFGQAAASSMAYLIEELLARRLDLLAADLARVAAELGMHPRTLQRRLSSEGRSYSAVVADTRRRLACEMLRSRELTLDEMAFKLGFSDRRSFTIAFRKWLGKSPRAYREASGFYAGRP